MDINDYPIEPETGKRIIPPLRMMQIMADLDRLVRRHREKQVIEAREIAGWVDASLTSHPTLVRVRIDSVFFRAVFTRRDGTRLSITLDDFIEGNHPN